MIRHVFGCCANAGSLRRTSSYKYVEPVRKKAKRENLKGIECKQCRKFDDAVLSDEKHDPNVKQALSCEHHDGVSRHRYRYAPPWTPEGFWNICFEPEMRDCQFCSLSVSICSLVNTLT